VRGLERLHRRGVHEDDLVAYYAHCRFGDGGAVPSIDTPLHAFVRHAHVDHLHPDALIALATAVDGERLVDECYEGEVGWLPWRRPGFALGLALRDLQVARPQLVGAVLAGHGLICWADTSDECERRSMQLIARADAFVRERGRAAPFGPPRPGYGALPSGDRAQQAAALAPSVRGVAASERPLVGAFNDAPVVLEFLASEAAPRLVALGTSCPDHFLRTKIRPLLLDLPAEAPLDAKTARLHELHTAYRAAYLAYYDSHADESSPPMRGADPAIVLVPGVGMWSFGADAQSAVVAGEFYVNAINVMRGAESVSAYQPIDEDEKFRIEYWELEERKLRLRPPAPPLQGRVALVTGGASGIGLATARRLYDGGACVVVMDRDGDAAEKVAAELGAERVFAVEADVSDERAVVAAFDAACRRFGGVDIAVNNAGFASAAAIENTTVDDWDRMHAVLARGAYLVSREAARVMRAQAIGGDIVYVGSKNGIVAGPANLAYGAAKADQLHQVRLLAAELGRDGIRVNGVNPDGVVRGSGIFAGEWLAQRSAAHGVEPERLGEFYASRTLLGREVLPEHVADAIALLVEGRLSRTTGLVVPVDGGLAAAFLR
jgi:rhamnulose-1-phosphate aldolase/alcohol dehydrogenase